MPTRMQLKVGFVTFPYGGNGAAPSENPDVRNWLLKAVIAAKKDERISEVGVEDFNDTPITMTRNLAMHWAKENKVDVLVMIDSDQACDLYLGKSARAKPFFDTSFDFLYDHWHKGPVIVYAPYCGHPIRPDGSGGENIFAFLWRNKGSADPTVGMQLQQFTREEAMVRSGIEDVAAGATGCIMIDMRILDILKEPYFEYEYGGETERCKHCGELKPGPRIEKVTTEDVYFTRNASLMGCLKLGYNPLFVNWDAWAGHWKPQCVGKPVGISCSAVAQELGQAYVDGIETNTISKWVGPHVLPNGAAFPAEELVKTRTDWDDAGEKILDEWGVRLANVSGQPNGKKIAETIVDEIVGKCQSNGKVIHVEGMNADGKVMRIEDRIETPRFDAKEHYPSHYDFSECHNTKPEDMDELCKLVYNEAAIKGLKNERIKIVELGSWVGHSALAMAETCESVCDYEIFCVDHWKGGNAIQRKAAIEGDAFREFQKNTKGKCVHPVHGDTAEEGRKYQLRDIDVLFIDADHTYEGCKADIEAWLPHVKPKGLIIGHDYTFLFPGVKRAVHERFGYNVVTLGASMWVVRLDSLGEAEVLKDCGLVDSKAG